MSDEIMPEVRDTTSYGKREVSIANAFETDYGQIEYYDLDQHKQWNEERTEENAKSLPWEIVMDDKRQSIEWNEARARHVRDRLNEIIARWDNKK
jgi:hypothetical protein